MVYQATYGRLAISRYYCEGQRCYFVIDAPYRMTKIFTAEVAAFRCFRLHWAVAVDFHLYW